MTAKDAVDQDQEPQQVAEKFIVQYEGEDYNITDFLDSHPAGKTILLPFRNRDLTKKFLEVGHSDEAKKILRKHKVNKSVADLELLAKESGEKKRIKTEFVFKKLFTPEDEYLIHKTLGFLSLLSYLYRYFYVLPTTGNLGFEGTWLDLATLALHFFLSFSSLIFHVIKYRMPTRPLIIYEEYRLHAIVFTARGIAVSLVGMYMQNMQGSEEEIFLRRCILGGVLLSLHLLVDYITHLYGTKGVTAVRNDGKLTFQYLGLFYSYYQFAALASHITWNARLGDLGFNTLIAIQSSAFLMTLKRKSLIRWYSHAFWYSLALALSYFVMWSIKGSVFFLYPAGLFFLRVKFGVDKYILWAAYAFAFYYFGLNF
jgi:hypothetical protein